MRACARPRGALRLRSSLSNRCQWPAVPVLCYCLFLSTSEPKLEDGPTGHGSGTGLDQGPSAGLRGVRIVSLKSQHWTRAHPSLCGLPSVSCSARYEEQEVVCSQAQAGERACLNWHGPRLEFESAPMSLVSDPGLSLHAAISGDLKLSLLGVHS